jgi:hypothetical protein
VKNRFQNLPFKCNLQRYITVGGRTALQAAEMQDPDAAKFLRQLRKVGLYKLNRGCTS